MKKYVCVLSTNDYLDGCLVLNENLKHVHSEYSLLCLINEKIDKETRNFLDKFGIEYKVLKKVNYDVDYNYFVQPYFKNTFDKLSVFNLIEYEKIVYLDLDLLILENIDELFDYDGLSMAKDYPFTEYYNSGVMVIEPRKYDYDGLIKLMKEKMDNKEHISDQNIINEYFKDNINILPQVYNLLRRIYGDQERQVYAVWNWDNNIEGKKILHYIISPKPFQIDDPFEEKYSYLYSYYMAIIKEKKNV
jgi:glycogenin glucosyltransferase